MNRRSLFCALAAAAVLCTASTADAKHHHDLCFKLKMKMGSRTNGDACEAYAGNDAGPTDCGCGANAGCHKPKRHPLGGCCKSKGCMPANCEPKCEAPAPCDTCDSCGDSCCARPLRDFFAALHNCCRSLCCDLCDPCGCGAPETASSCGCGH